MSLLAAARVPAGGEEAAAGALGSTCCGGALARQHHPLAAAGSCCTAATAAGWCLGRTMLSSLSNLPARPSARVGSGGIRGPWRRARWCGGAGNQSPSVVQYKRRKRSSCSTASSSPGTRAAREWLHPEGKQHGDRLWDRWYRCREHTGDVDPDGASAAEVVVHSRAHGEARKGWGGRDGRGSPRPPA